MKITGFCPLIVTQDADTLVKVFEDLGFEKRHTKTDVEGGTNIQHIPEDHFSRPALRCVSFLQ